MEVIFVRHAQPEWIREGRSVLDPRLTELGRSQAERLAARAEAWRGPETELLVSPTARTRETAAPLAQTLGIQPTVVDALEEIRLPPEWEGAPADAISEGFRAAKLREAEAWWSGIPGGESFHDFWARVRGAISNALESRGATSTSDGLGPPLWQLPSGRRRLVIVGHGGTNAAALHHLLGIEPVPWPWERFVALHASVTRLRTTPIGSASIFGLREHSDVAHLPETARTR